MQRQLYRGVVYLLIDGASGRQQRINRSAYELIGRFDGRTSVNQAWTLLLEQLGDDAPTQEEVVRIVARLSESELVQLETKPDIEGLFEKRAERLRRRRPWSTRSRSRCPSSTPRACSSAWSPRRAGCCIRRPSRLGAAVLAAALAAGAHWNVLQDHAAKYMTTAYYLTLAWICYPPIKGCTSSHTRSPCAAGVARYTRWASRCFSSCRRLTWTLRRRMRFAAAGTARR